MEKLFCCLDGKEVNVGEVDGLEGWLVFDKVFV